MRATTLRAARSYSVCPLACGRPLSSKLQPESIQASAEESIAFHDVFHDYFSQREQHQWSLFYLCRQLSNIERKTIEPLGRSLLVQPRPRSVHTVNSSASVGCAGQCRCRSKIYTDIRLRANLSTTDPHVTPVLKRWRVDYTFACQK